MVASTYAGPSSLFWGGGSGNWSNTANWSPDEFGPYNQTFADTAATFGVGGTGAITLTQDIALTVFYVSSSSASYTFDLGSYDLSVTSGDFSLQSTTTFDFGHGDASLTVGSGLSNLDFGSGITVSVANYQVGSDVIRFGISSSGLSSTQLDQIMFSGYSLGGAAQIDANGFVTPIGVSAVPEPATYAAIVGALALGATVIVRRRRRAA